MICSTTITYIFTSYLFFLHKKLYKFLGIVNFDLNNYLCYRFNTMIKNLILTSLLLLSPSIVLAQTPPSNLVNTNTTNITVGNSPTIVLPFDGTRGAWTIHPEGTSPNIRCNFGNAYGSVPSNPTTSVGFEITAGSYQNNFPSINASGEVLCISESGSAPVSAAYSNR